jgi:hypothetical protein
MHVRLEDAMIMRIGDHHAEIPQIEKDQLRERASNLQPGEGMIFHTHHGIASRTAGDSKNWFCYNCASADDAECAECSRLKRQWEDQEQQAIAQRAMAALRRDRDIANRDNAGNLLPNTRGARQEMEHRLDFNINWAANNDAAQFGHK